MYTHTHTHTSWNVNALCLSLCLACTLSHSNHERLHMVHKVEWPATVAVGSRQRGWWQCLLSQLSYQKPQLMPVSVLCISTVTVKTSTYVSHQRPQLVSLAPCCTSQCRASLRLSTAGRLLLRTQLSVAVFQALPVLLDSGSCSPRSGAVLVQPLPQDFEALKHQLLFDRRCRLRDCPRAARTIDGTKHEKAA